MSLLIQRAKRFEIAARVAYWWSPTKGVVQSGTGVTRNIANSGVLIAASECPDAGSPIQVSIFIPRIGGKGYGMKLHGEGVVVRVESATMPPDLRPTGFAASVQFYPEPMDGSEQLGQTATGDTIDTALSRVL